jgi:protein involved in polysaccharide export with SLBB domain
MALLLLASCQASPAGIASLAPDQSDATQDSAARLQNTSGYRVPEYRVQEGDKLSIHFYYTPELNTDQVVRSDGKVSLTYLPALKVSGLTVDAVRAAASSAYHGILNDPVITVTVVASTAGRVFIGGEVYRPGEIALGGRSSFLQMLFKAGGLKPSAAPGKILLIRHDDQGTIARLRLNANAMLTSQAAAQDIRMLPYDIVYVPKSTIAKVDEAADQYIHQLVPLSFAFQHVTNQNTTSRVINSSTTTALPTAGQPTTPPTTP